MEFVCTRCDALFKEYEMVSDGNILFEAHHYQGEPCPACYGGYLEEITEEEDNNDYP